MSETQRQRGLKTLTPAQQKARDEQLARVQSERRAMRIEASKTARVSRRRRDLGRLARQRTLTTADKQRLDDLAVAVAADEREDTEETQEETTDD